MPYVLFKFAVHECSSTVVSVFPINVRFTPVSLRLYQSKYFKANKVMMLLFQRKSSAKLGLRSANENIHMEICALVG